jgi:hypothetical protein
METQSQAGLLVMQVSGVEEVMPWSVHNWASLDRLMDQLSEIVVAEMNTSRNCWLIPSISVKGSEMEMVGYKFLHN